MKVQSARAEVWLTDGDAAGAASLSRFHGWLGPDELARHQRFVREQRRRQFVVGRGLLRMALGRALNVAPQTICLEERPGMAPRLLLPELPAAAGVGFSISHSGRWVACAASAQTALGLDIEMRDASRDIGALAAQAFDAFEMSGWERLQSLPEAQRVDGFYRLWSEKEARFKLGPSPETHCVVLPHAELSVVLCSATPLLAVPRLELVELD
jgi:4'-phosphopantetheinyl transferase